MDQEKNMELLLWEYIDGQLSGEEKAKVEQLLHQDAEWKKTFLEIKEMNALLMSSETEQPSMRFSKNVMDEIARYKIAPATKSYVNKKIVYGIAGFFLVLIAGFLIYLFTQIDFSASSSTPMPVELPEVKVDWKKWINSTSVQLFLMADIVFGLMLLDRYLNKRKNTAINKLQH
jgi:hypothetical protein